MADMLRLQAWFRAQSNASTPNLQPGSSATANIPFTSPFANYGVDQYQALTQTAIRLGTVKVARVYFSPTEYSFTVGPVGTGGVLVVPDDPAILSLQGSVTLREGSTFLGIINPAIADVVPSLPSYPIMIQRSGGASPGGNLTLTSTGFDFTISDVPNVTFYVTLVLW